MKRYAAVIITTLRWFRSVDLPAPQIRWPKLKHPLLGDEDLLEDLNAALRPHGYYVDLESARRGIGVFELGNNNISDEEEFPPWLPPNIQERYVQWAVTFIRGNMRLADKLYSPYFVDYVQQLIGDALPERLNLWRGVRAPQRLIVNGRVPLLEDLPTISCTDSREVATEFANMGMIGSGPFPGEKLVPIVLRVRALRTSVVYHYQYMHELGLDPYFTVDMAILKHQREVILRRHYSIVQEVAA